MELSVGNKALPTLLFPAGDISHVARVIRLRLWHDRRLRTLLNSQSSIDPAISFFSGLDSDMSRHDLLCGPDDILRFIRLMMSGLAQQIRSKPKLCYEDTESIVGWSLEDFEALSQA